MTKIKLYDLISTYMHIKINEQASTTLFNADKNILTAQK